MRCAYVQSARTPTSAGPRARRAARTPVTRSLLLGFSRVRMAIPAVLGKTGAAMGGLSTPPPDLPRQPASRLSAPRMNTADSLRSERYLESGDEAGTSPADRKYRPDVEGLRAVAILLVLLGHFDVPGTSGGFLGVDIFFVISGFVVTGLLIRGRASAGRIQLADFFARRCRRIIPLAATVIVLTMILQRVLFGRATAHFVAGPACLMLLFVYNVSPSAPKAWIVPGNIAVYWSLCVEEQFYLIYPLLLIAVALGNADRVALQSGSGDRGGHGCLIRLDDRPVLTWLVPRHVHLDPWPSVGAGPGVPARFQHPPSAANPPWTRRGAGMERGGLDRDRGLHLEATRWCIPELVSPLSALGAVLIIAGGTPVPRWGPERVLGLARCARSDNGPTGRICGRSRSSPHSSIGGVPLRPFRSSLVSPLSQRSVWPDLVLLLRVTHPPLKGAREEQQALVPRCGNNRRPQLGSRHSGRPVAIGRRYTWWAVSSFGAGLSLVLLTICLFLLVASAWMGFSSRAT